MLFVLYFVEILVSKDYFYNINLSESCFKVSNVCHIAVVV